MQLVLFWFSRAITIAGLYLWHNRYNRRPRERHADLPWSLKYYV